MITRAVSRVFRGRVAAAVGDKQFAVGTDRGAEKLHKLTLVTLAVRPRAAHRARLTAGERILDLAAGTGTSSVPFHDKGATVVPCDFSLGMLQVGKQARPHLPFTAGDGTRLPFADATFDAAFEDIAARIQSLAPRLTTTKG